MHDFHFHSHLQKVSLQKCFSEFSQVTRGSTFTVYRLAFLYITQKLNVDFQHKQLRYITKLLGVALTFSISFDIGNQLLNVYQGYKRLPGFNSST